MPHLQIQYSKNLEEQANLSDFCAILSQEIEGIGLFPLGGIRVRAQAMEHYSIADGHSKNTFLDMVFRIGQGRSEADIRDTGERLMARAKQFFATALASGYCMVSLEIVEINKNASWKINSVHKRLQEEVR